ncbi:LAG1-domain-containing protein, partial [Ramicandelaber brevisporus]
YVKGPHDAAFVLHLILVVTFSRAFVLRLAFWFSRQIGVAKHAKQLRFAEQSWAFLYYSFQFLTGLSIAYNSEFWMDIKHLFIGYPHIQHTHQLKLYYLTCMSFWMQQFFVIHVEERRKDHWQMLLHHVVTTGLLLASYYTNFVRMGIAIQVMFDAADILLALAKLFRYAGFSKLTDMLFVGFVLVWLVTRHIMFGYLWYDAYNTVEKYIDYEWAPSEGKFFTERTKMFFHCMFAALMALVLFWFALILKLVVRVASGNNVDDNRSDSEDES